MRVLGMLGVRAVVLTNAAGGIHPRLHGGQLVALADHINHMGFNPLVGPNEPRFALNRNAGLRFFDMTEAYSKRLRALASQAAREEGFTLDEGVYLATPGPSFETPAGNSRLSRAGGHFGGHVHGARDDCGAPHGH